MAYGSGYIAPTNPVNDFIIAGPNAEGQYWIEVNEYCTCGHPCCSKPVTGTKVHTSAPRFDDYDEANDWIEAVGERWEEDYDNYLEENRHAIVQSERYEIWRNEY
jgi:hypothetical protein